MQKTKFKFDGNDYKIIIQSRRTIGAIRLLEDCCAESCVIMENEPPKLVKSTADYTLRSLCWFMADRAMLEAAQAEKTGPNAFEFSLPGGKKYDALKPLSVPGTSKGVQYSTLLTTYNGTISYQHGKIMEGKPPRIRLVKTDSNAAWPDQKINNSGMYFQTHENTHMSHTGETVDHTRKLIARGAHILICIKKDFE